MGQYISLQTLSTQMLRFVQCHDVLPVTAAAMLCRGSNQLMLLAPTADRLLTLLVCILH